MNRQILFRGLTVSTNEWVEGDFITGVGAKQGRVYILPRIINFAYPKTKARPHELDGHEVLPSSVGQFTGLLDKNGVKIFEGDVVIWNDGDDGDKRIRKATVVMHPSLRFVLTDDTPTGMIGHEFCFGHFIYEDTENHIDVIGNIHEGGNK
jgi:hypothetical protein